MQYGGKQNNKWNSSVSGIKRCGSKTGSLVQKISKIDSRRLSNKFSHLSKKIVYKNNPATGMKISSFQPELGNIDPRSEHFICSTRVRDTILEIPSAKDYSKTGENVQNTETVNIFGDYGIS